MDRLERQYSDLNMKYMFREQIIDIRDSHAKKRHPTENDKLLVEAYDKLIDELTEELAENPTLEELSAEIYTLGITEPYPEDYDGVQRSFLVEIK